MKVYGLSNETIERHQWGDPLLRHLTDKILNLVDLPGGRALEVGCGAGRIAITCPARASRWTGWTWRPGSSSGPQISQPPTA